MYKVTKNSSQHLQKNIHTTDALCNKEGLVFQFACNNPRTTEFLSKH